ncbi:DUF6843 domain-containing protein [Flavobacterium sp. RHBU_24]|uniref:DUF6843 domain-containing protein n=1 Tax=Flavobacterium sp. RHBU_24 TaxID=3391185 RepID=UPI003984A9D3
MKTKIFYPGVFLIAASFIACVISFYFIVFGAAVFLVGALLVLLSDRTVKTKLLTTLLPVVLYVPVTIAFLYLYNFSLPKTMLIPEGYDGPLRVVYEESCGSPYSEIDGETTLVFPENGILVLNEDFDNHVNYTYYFINKAGKRTPIKDETVVFEKGKMPLPRIEAVGSGQMGVGIVAMGDESGQSEAVNSQEKDIVYTEFYVYNKDTTPRYDYKGQEKFGALTARVVKRCRLKK